MRVSDGYFDSIGTKILKGRGISNRDTATSRIVAVVNHAFAKKFFKDEDPIGKHFGDLDQKYAGAFEIVGITEDDPIPAVLPAKFHQCSSWPPRSRWPTTPARLKAFEDALTT